MSLVFNAPPFYRLQDLIQSELAGLAFDSLQQVFRKVDIQNMFEMEPMPLIINQEVFVVKFKTKLRLSLKIFLGMGKAVPSPQVGHHSNRS